MNTFQALTEYYGSYDEDGRLRSKHGMVEYLTTMRYIEKYLKPGMRILEIGAATGRYSHAMELSFFEEDTYDITLLLGPMYHLFTEEEQLQAIKEAIRVTKRGGIVYAAYCNNDATMVQYCFGRGMLKLQRYRDLVDLRTFKASSDPAELFELYRKEDIDALMSHFAVTRLHYIGTDMATNFMRSAVDEMDDEIFELYLRYHFAICERSDMVGATHHILDVFQKN